MSGQKFCVEYAKRGTAGCKGCKTKIQKGFLRIAKLVTNPFSDSGGDMKQWFHVKCIFDQLSRARATTKRIEDPGDLDGWDQVKSADRKTIIQHINALPDRSSTTPKKKTTPQKSESPKATTSGTKKAESNTQSSSSVTSKSSSNEGKDGEFRTFRTLCAQVAEVGSYLEKTKIVSNFFKTGKSGKGFQGNLLQWVRLLLPGVHKAVYNLQSKQLIKLFSQLFRCDQDAMLTDLELGDIAETVRIFFEQSNDVTPIKKSSITLTEVEDLLEKLSQETKEDDQLNMLKKICKRCTSNDLKMIVRLIKHDLRINAGPKHILEALHPSAYEAFQSSRDLSNVIKRILDIKSGLETEFTVSSSLMTPVLPMLAEACRSVEYAFKKCPSGMFAEIKYDGERVQLHQQGTTFSFFSRSLKPVMPHKVQHLKDFILKAFPKGNDLILDSEILLVDTKTSKPLPFGTLGKHKKEAFKEASVCLFVFDCLHYNGDSLMNKPFCERRKILENNMTVIPNHVVFSEILKIENEKGLKDLIDDVISQGLEGLVIKDIKGKYEPGKRHWLKVKKDYLEEGAMADTADLVVLGAYFGTGNKGGMMSIFLMGCWDEDRRLWVTVNKVHGGHDDATLDKLQNELDMVKIQKDPNRIPSWLDINRTLIPDFVIKDPKESQVWEITGAEFTRAEAHTADGISIRFPRVTRIRPDKGWKEATSLKELKVLFQNSKTTSDFKGIQSHKKQKRKSNEDSDVSSTEEAYDTTPVKKFKLAPSSPSPKKPTPQKFTPATNVTKVSSSFKEMFPDVFSQVRLYLPECVNQYEVLKRYFIAYDGDLVPDYELDRATHVLVPEGKSPEDLGDLPLRAHRLTEHWLWDSVKLQKLQDTRHYVAGT